ncbi:MAG: hypothetical protein WCP28_04645 [Actinomycetes bacterium]
MSDHLICGACGRDMPHGEPYVCISYNIEHTDPDYFVIVERNNPILQLCLDCAPPEAKIVAALSAFG